MLGRERRAAHLARIEQGQLLVRLLRCFFAGGLGECAQSLARLVSASSAALQTGRLLWRTDVMCGAAEAALAVWSAAEAVAGLSLRIRQDMFAAADESAAVAALERVSALVAPSGQPRFLEAQPALLDPDWLRTVSLVARSLSGWVPLLLCAPLSPETEAPLRDAARRVAGALLKCLGMVLSLLSESIDAIALQRPSTRR